MKKFKIIIPNEAAVLRSGYDSGCLRVRAVGGDPASAQRTAVWV